MVTWQADPHDAKFFVFSKDAFGLRPQHDKALPGASSVILSDSEESPLSGPWTVTFQEGRGAPASAVFQELVSYTESDDPGIKYFSGTATYSNIFSLPSLCGHVILDLGNVQNIAEVIVNGHAVRTLWKVPYRVEITDFVHEGDNALEVRVTNLWPNRLIGDARLPEEERLTYTSYPFYHADDKLSPAGLIGPFRIYSF